jgi:HPt (histidine-containing phosphotransfer) domain-containing protein
MPNDPAPEHPTVQIERRMADLVARYLERCRADVAAMRSALEGGTLATVRGLGDRLAGSGAACGFGEISARGFAIERAARDADLFAIREAVEAVDRYLAHVVVTYRD